MHILFLDTASAEPVLILSTTEKVLVKRTLPKQGESHITKLLEEALKEAGWRYEDHVNSRGEHVAGLTHIDCIIGPGGFVSSRVGITTANVLAHFLAIPLVGIHLSELWEARVPSPYPLPRGEGLYWLHSTRRNQLFVRGFGEFAKRFPEPTLVGIEEVATLEAQYVGELLEEHKKALPGCTPLSSDFIQPLEEVLPLFLKNLEYQKQQLLPWYGREA